MDELPRLKQKEWRKSYIRTIQEGTNPGNNTPPKKKQQLHDRLLPIAQIIYDEQDMLDITGEVWTNS